MQLVIIALVKVGKRYKINNKYAENMCILIIIRKKSPVCKGIFICCIVVEKYYFEQ